MRKVLIIGAGGIGSFLIPLLDKTGLYEITVYDPDKVETKNLSYQNFEKKDVSLHKVSVMDRRYPSVKKAETYPILVESQVKGYDLVVCCADNLTVRRLLYKHADKWLDLRAQGRNGAFISHLANTSMHDTVLAGPDGSFSCQGSEWSGLNTAVHFMQVAIAGMGAQWIQRFLNGEQVGEYQTVNV